MSDRLEEFTMRLMLEVHDRYQKCEDFAATPSSILLAITNAIAKVREEMGYENPSAPSNVWRVLRVEDAP